MSIATIDKRPGAEITPFEPRGLEEAMKLAQSLSRSALLPDALRGKPEDLLLVMLTGHEFGLSTMQAIRGISVIKGKPVMDAALIVALVRRHRDVCQYFRLVSSTPTEATYETHRVGEPEPVRMSYTIEDAKTAGLNGKDNWRNHPKAMLRARCSSALARAVYQDLCFGIYDPDEAEEIVAQAMPATNLSAPPRPAAQARPQAVAPSVESVNPETGEVTSAAEAPVSDADDSELSDLTNAINTSESPEQLEELMPRIRAQPETAKQLLRTIYTAKKRSFVGVA